MKHCLVTNIVLSGQMVPNMFWRTKCFTLFDQMFDIQILSSTIKQGFQTGKMVGHQTVLPFWTRLKKVTTQAHKKRLTGCVIWWVYQQWCVDINGKDYIDKKKKKMFWCKNIFGKESCQLAKMPARISAKILKELISILVVHCCM